MTTKLGFIDIIGALSTTLLITINGSNDTFKIYNDFDVAKLPHVFESQKFSQGLQKFGSVWVLL